jgi:putative ABC transport system permease protein
VTVLFAQLRDLRSRPSRLLLTALAVAVAAAFAFGAVLVRTMLVDTLVDRLSSIPAAADLVVGADGALPPAAAEEVAAVPGVAATAGRTSWYGEVRGAADAGAVWQLSGDSGAGPLSVVDVVAGTYPRTAGEVAVTEGSARRAGVKLGATLEVVTDGTASGPMTVTAIVSVTPDAGERLFLLPEAAVALAGSYDRLDVSLAPGADADEVRSRIAAITGAEPVAGAQAREQQARDESASINAMFVVVGVFVLVAVIAAVLVTVSTFRIVFAQRMRQLALLRAVGAGRRQLTGALVAEGAVTGAVAGVLGVLTALVLAYAAVLGLKLAGQDVAGPGLPWAAAAGSVLAATAVTALAVLAPALAAARVHPLQALRTSAVADTAARIGPLRILTGVAAIAGAVLCAVPVLAAGEGGGDMLPLLLVVASGTSAFVALLALGPWLVPMVARLLGRPVEGMAGVPGQLSVRGVLRAPRRAAATGLVVTLGVTLVTSLVVGSSSLRAHAEEELDERYPVDMMVTSADYGALPPSLTEGLADVPAVERAVPVFEVDGSVTGLSDVELLTMVTGAPVAELPGVRRWRTLDGDIADVAPGRVALSRSSAEDLGVTTGDVVSVTVGERRVGLHVAAVYAGRAALPLVADPADLAALTGDAPATSVWLDLRDGDAAPEQARKAVQSATPADVSVVVRTVTEKREELQSTLLAVTGIALALLSLTLLIAAVGVATTMALSVGERRREFGLLRALGLARRGLQASVTLESCLLAAVGAIPGLVLGVVYGWLGLTALQLEARLAVPVLPLVAVAIAVGLLAVVAGLLPSRRAAATPPVAVLAEA